MQIQRFCQLLFIPLLIIACGTVNEPVEIDDGAQIEDDVRNVNGPIHVGSSAVIKGKVQNVNGTIRIGSGSRTGAIENTNGSIEIAEDAATAAVHNTNGGIRIGSGSRINGDVISRNGAIDLAERVSVSGSLTNTNGRIRADVATRIEGEVSTVNGPIHLAGSEVGQVTTTHGNIDLVEAAVVAGDLIVRERQGGADSSPPEITIGAGSVVRGRIDVRGEARLYVHEDARIGEVVGVEPVRFSGDRP